MKLEYNQKAIITPEEFGWETYPLDVSIWDVIYEKVPKKTKKKIRTFDGELALVLLRRWDISDVMIQDIFNKISEVDNRSESEQWKKDAWKAHYVGHQITCKAGGLLSRLTNRALEESYESICKSRNSCSWGGSTERYYRHPSLKGVTKTDYSDPTDGRIPSIRLESTSEINLEEELKRIKSYIGANWDLPKVKGERK